ncbi:MAG: 16S rRNA (cytosine(1402)-N(4))-methyltransferase, partial [Clostridia bacterium]|nr:16S rRNA (cytosine(1402)-N(4))-methyltransferase [Clostridia bacterium]
MEFSHKPIMLQEVIEGLAIRPQGTYVDCTTGGAGHSKEIARRLDGGKLICIDKDQDALSVARERLEGYNVEFIHGDFKDILPTLKGLDGILMDLGVSSYQIDTASRGFSYRLDGDLDMRMDQTASLSAKTVVN